MIKDIITTLGDNMGGILWLWVCPIEWLSMPVVVDGSTVSVRQPLAFKPGKKLLKIACQTDTLELKEKPKQNSSGDYYEQEINGVINLDDVEKSVVLDEMRYHQLIVLVPDKNGRTHIIGTHEYGMKLMSELEIENQADGKSSYSITLAFESEAKSAFYEV